ncbi:dTDP-4-dehydrorhamnose reductase [Sphingobium limneticum]|jgi:dTDP-4-dehydrorhamnose reductase|uniref:dTDP-4-dehydrorhamnose reductase n=1 Tax=Sphingobium TaxID=165695 RepID=UPI003137B0CA
MTRILVTGSQGQVACSLRERLKGHELHFTERPDFDLANPGSIDRAVDAVAPALIISTAAYTAVDRAEDEPELAMAINGIGPSLLARAAARNGAAILHLSTDYVFDGSGQRPWREDDRLAPLGVYGQSKLVGERAIAQSGVPHAILRTSWVYSPFGSNFVKTMLRLAQAGQTVRVVDDQVGCPTSALDLADAIGALIDMWTPSEQPPWHGIYHLAGTGSTSWADFARAIFAWCDAHGEPHVSVRGISTTDFLSRAPRPANSRLDCGHIQRAFGIVMPTWPESLEKILLRLK